MAVFLRLPSKIMSELDDELNETIRSSEDKLSEEEAANKFLADDFDKTKPYFLLKQRYEMEIYQSRRSGKNNCRKHEIDVCRLRRSR